MKLTKKEEIEVVKVYDIWLNSYLNGDVKTYDSYLDDEYHFIGSTNNEEFLTRKAATTFFKVTADQLAGKTDVRNTIRTIEYFDGLVFITELFDAWFMMGDNWTYYGRFRFTSALRNKNQGWRFIYQHFSMPDSKAQEGETLGAEQVSKENQELRDAIKRRTKELEQKNRELEIEAALERVRTRTMAMQISNELKDAAALLFQQAKALGVPAYSCGYNIWEEDEKSFTSWMSTQDGSDFNAVLNIPLTEDANFIRFDESRKKREQFFVLELSGKRMQEHYKYLKTIPAFEAYFDYAVSVGFDLPAAQIHHIANFSKGNLMFITLEPCPEFHNVFKRFAAVFDQAYTRFLDLQKAEAQAREAEIQLALERVRSRSLAMHHTSELQEVVNIVAQQLQSMGMDTSGGVVIIINNEVEEDLPVWASSGAADYMQKVVVPSFDRPIFTDLRDAIKQGIGFFSGEYSHEEKIEFFEHLFRYDPWSSTPGEWKENLFSRVGGLTRSAAISRHTCIAVTSHYGKKFSNNEKEILKRFTSVFEQSYIRFLDLQKAEAQAREAQIEAALERVRGKAMAMHHSDELSDVLSILFEQFDILGIRPVDAHLDLFNWEKNTFTYRATGKEGKRVIAEQIVDLDSRPEWKALADKWKKSKPKSIDLSFYPKQVIGELMKFFPDIWAAMPADAIMDPDDFPDGMFDTLGYHKFGYLGFHHYRKATEEETNILFRFASEFERLYQRFLDLQKAEALAEQARLDLIQIQTEKQRAEKALHELQATQKQLIQSEKMASLGELTAGIAHEIQNPLNFVNNFSEVSNELIGEMNTALDKGDINEAKAIANDVQHNLEKINHHGQRAADIVKGMLQHSRSSSGQKEPTDINALCDEYLRLSYHGLRAKDKNFNATIKTDFDNSIGNINIIPQDIGRVVLNLINNAFYATGERRKTEGEGFEPEVSVSTKKAGDKVLIIVNDNGPGIPQKILDKIFQPFFTTKPTGQGTGLGLSLSYDIITKGHNGELKVETKHIEGLPADLSVRNDVKAEASSDAIGFGRRQSAQAGSKFIILLPV